MTTLRAALLLVVMAWLWGVLSVLAAGCAVKTESPDLPQPPAGVVFGDTLPDGLQLCVPRPLGMPPHALACMRLDELRRQLRGMRLAMR